MAIQGSRIPSSCGKQHYELQYVASEVKVEQDEKMEAPEGQIFMVQIYYFCLLSVG